MSQPPYPYNRIFDFESFSIVNPTTQQPGVQIEGELDNVKRTLDSVISRLSEIQRDDGYIRDSALDQSTVIPQFYSRLSLLFAPSFALKANINSPTFTGVVTIPANAVIVGFAKLDSPNLTGVPTAPTPATLNSSQQIANSSFVTAADAVIKQFAIDADAVIKQFVIDNYLKLDGDQMHDDSIIFWTKETPSQWAPYATGNEKDSISHSINKDGISLLSEKFELSNDGDTGLFPNPANLPHEGEYAEGESFKDKRTTVINPGVIELKEFTQSVHYQSEYVLKGKITIWSGQSNDQGLNSLPIFNPLSGPHMSFWDRYETYGPNPMMISSMGLQFPDGSNQDTRGLSGQEVYDIANYEANLAVDNLVAGAPAALNTLKEIADALANDANLAGTLTAAIALKADDNAVLKLAGGSMTDDAAIDIKSATGNTDSEVGAWGFGVEQTDTPTTGATLEKTGLHVYSDGSNMNVSAVGITFPNGSVQTVAATNFNPTGYATQSWVSNTALSGYATQSWVTARGYLDYNAAATQFVGKGQPGSVPTSGGTSGQILTKVGSSPGVCSWQTPAQPNLTGYATESWVYGQGFVQASVNGYKDYLNGFVSGSVTTSVMDGWSQSMVDVTIIANNGLAKWDGYTVVFQISQNRSINEFDIVSGNQIIVYLGNGSTSLQNWGPSLIEIDGNGSGVVIGVPSGSPYIGVGVLDGLTIPLSLELTTGSSLLYKEGTKSAFIEDLSSLITNGDYYYKTIVAVTKNQLEAVRVATWNEVGAKLDKTGGALTGKLTCANRAEAGINIGIGGTNTSATTPGDLWISTGGTSLNYRDGNGTWRTLTNTASINTFTQPQIIATTITSTTPALRITNLATASAAHSLLVEDDTNPDTTSFIVTNSGNVGIGVATGYTATQKVEVVGNVKADGFVNGSGPVFTVKSVSAHANGADTHDIFMSVNGSTYRIPAIFVSTP